MGQIEQLPPTQAIEAVETTRLEELIRAAKDGDPVSGLTHNFYRYPARFSPVFAKAAILAFTKPGDTVYDPFMGGGTTLVEASVLGRKAVGTDVNPLAVFVARVKTTRFSEGDLVEVHKWSQDVGRKLNLRNPPVRAADWIERGYQRNISDRITWPIRKTIELAMHHVERLRTDHQREFARCALLRTSQWALDCRTTIPSAEEFREHFREHLNEMLNGAREYAQALSKNEGLCGVKTCPHPLCLTRSVVGVETHRPLKGKFPPALILTSPPYPGVHVLYHRWQVQGRKETPAPFWIAGSLDGNGESYYTFGDRKQPELAPYYQHLRAAYRSIARIAAPCTLLVQLLAFSDPSWQLTRYLGVMEEAGFREIRFPCVADSGDGRIWRSVPHRKWYADQRGATTSSKEVVLFHCLARSGTPPSD